MKLSLAYYGNPILRKKVNAVEEITDDIRNLVADMIETMHESRGVGLAAPQVSQNLRIFVTCAPVDIDAEEWIPGPDKVFINPKIEAPSEETWTMNEGCLSIPGINGEVTRPWEVTVTWTCLDGAKHKETFSGYEARVIMHENDHLNGVLYIDRLSKEARKAIDSELKNIKN